MSIFYSLKYRIALSFFIIQFIVVSLLLWQTQNSAFNEAQSLIRSQDQTILQVLSSVSESSLFVEDYFEIQPFFLQVVESSHVLKAYVIDAEGFVMVSSDNALLGVNQPAIIDDNKSYWMKSLFESGDESIGELHIQFSKEEVNKAFDAVLTQATFLGLISLIITSVLSILMGQLLTKRLERIRFSTERFAEGDLTSRCHISGNDELSDLGLSLNKMADQINQTMQEIEHLAFHDELTGLANRREFDKRLDKAFVASKKHGHFYALLYLDLDKFKLVNDTCGHHAGDQFLIQLSNVMLEVIRNRDTLVRFGGDEFGVLLENCSLSQAEEVANKLLASVYDFKFSWEDKIMQVGVSIGVVALNAHTESVEQLMSSADAACYTAKKKGRNQVHMVMPGDSSIKGYFSDIDWINRLSTMIEKDLFTMAYQKISPLKESTELVRMEFLLRMKNEQGEWISPTIFIDAAERFDVIQRLDRYVINKVFRLIANAKNPEINMMCFINLSGKSIGEEGLYNFVRDKIVEYGLNAKQICFEITETAAIANFNHASVFIEKARALGCSFALDDFGSGMCSFNYLKNLQVDYVKIDGNFILNMHQNPIDKTIVKSINEISHSSGFKTIAEFVENDAIYKEVKMLGIDYAQGNGLHKATLVQGGSLDFSDIID